MRTSWQMLWALGLIVGLHCPGHAREIELHKRFSRSFGRTGWLTYVHNVGTGERLVAFNPDRLEIEVVDPKTGRTMDADRLNSRAHNVRFVATLSTHSGSFFLAFVTDENVVELHQLNHNAAFEIPLGAPPSGLQLSQMISGRVMVTVTTGRRREHFVLQRGNLEPEDDSRVVIRDRTREAANQLTGSPNGRWDFVRAEGNQSGTLKIFDPRAVTSKLELPVGNAQQVSHVGRFRIRGRTYYYFVKDQLTLQVQNDNEVALIANPKSERIVSVLLLPKSQALSVRLEGPKGDRLFVLSIK